MRISVIFLGLLIGIGLPVLVTGQHTFETDASGDNCKIFNIAQQDGDINVKDPYSITIKAEKFYFNSLQPNVKDSIIAEFARRNTELVTEKEYLQTLRKRLDAIISSPNIENVNLDSVKKIRVEIDSFLDQLTPMEKWVNGRTLYGYEKNGVTVIQPEFEKAFPFQNGVAKVQMGGKWGFIDSYGKWVIIPKYDNVNDFFEGLALVELGPDKYYINYCDSICIDLGREYKKAGNFKEGKALAQRSIDNRYGFFTKNGGFHALNSGYSYVGEFNNGLAVIEVLNCFPPGKYIGKRYNGYGYIDSLFSWSIPPVWEAAQPFQKNGIANVKISGKWRTINSEGDTLSYALFDSIAPFSDGMAIVAKKEDCCLKYGAINERGQLTSKCKYLHLSKYQYGISIFNNGHLDYGVIDKNGRVLFKGQFSMMKILPGGNISVIRRNQEFVLNSNGKCIDRPLVWDLMNKYWGVEKVIGSDSLYKVRGDDFNYGVIDIYGKEIVPSYYCFIGEIEEGTGLLHVFSRKRCFRYTTKGKLIVNRRLGIKERIELKKMVPKVKNRRFRTKKNI